MRAMSTPRREFDWADVQLLVDSIPALIHTARPDGYLDYFNKPWLEYLGVTLGKVAGWNWTAFIHPEDVDGIVTQWRACLVSGETFEYETRVRKANGEYRWMFHRKVPLRDANGNIVKWYGSSLDIDGQNGGRTAPPQRRRAAKKRVLSCRRAAPCPHGKLGLRSRWLLLLVSRVISDVRTRSGQQTA